MAANNYAACLAKVLKYEGGYVNDPHDPGGETNYGITVAVARANGYSGPMRSIPMDLVRKIYKTRYWDAVKGDDLPAGLDLCVFDYAVNSGPGRALSTLPRTTEFGSIPRRINVYCSLRLEFLRGLKTWSRYGKGWSSRVADVETTALKLAGPKGEPEKSKTVDAGKVGGGAVAGGSVVVATGTAIEAGWSYGEIAMMLFGVIVLAGLAYLAWRWWKARADSAVPADEIEAPAVSDTPEAPQRFSVADTAIADDLANSIATAAKARVAVEVAANPRRKPKKASTVKRRTKRTAKKRRA